MGVFKRRRWEFTFHYYSMLPRQISRSYCTHGIIKSVCKICSNCGHGMLKKTCKICSNCGHGRLKVNCKYCSDCGHGSYYKNCVSCNDCGHRKFKHNCAICSDCGHGNLKRRCRECKKSALIPDLLDPSILCTYGAVVQCQAVGMDVPSVVQAVVEVPVNCEHYRNKSLCRLCSGCKHGKLIEDCSNVECSGCKHGFRNTCKVCRLCKHDILKSECEMCGKAGFCLHGINTYRMAQPCIDCDRNALDHTARKQANKEVDSFLSYQRVLPIISHGSVLNRGPATRRAKVGPATKRAKVGPASPFCLSNDLIALPTPPILSYETILGRGPVAKRADAASPFGLSDDLIAIFTPSVPDSQPKESAEPEEEWSPDEDFEPSLVTCSICRKTVDAMSARYSRLGGGSFVCSDC